MKQQSAERYAVIISVQQPVLHFRLLGVFASYEAALRRADRRKGPGTIWWGPVRVGESLLRRGEKRLMAEELRLSRALLAVHRLLESQQRALNTLPCPVKRSNKKPCPVCEGYRYLTLDGKPAKGGPIRGGVLHSCDACNPKGTLSSIHAGGVHPYRPKKRTRAAAPIKRKR